MSLRLAILNFNIGLALPEMALWAEKCMLTQSDQIDQIASALADAQADLSAVFKHSQNEAFGSKYADLARVWEAFQRVGPRHGLSVVQMPGAFDAATRTMSMSVKLMHNSGQWLGGDMSMPLSRSDAHAYGSACTYARRYSLASLIGICPQDDDGNEASGVEVASAARRANFQPRYGAEGAMRAGVRVSGGGVCPAPGHAGEVPPRPAISGSGLPADPQGLGELRALALAAQVDEASLCRHYRVAGLDELSPRDAARARRALTRKVEARPVEARPVEVRRLEARHGEAGQ